MLFARFEQHDTEIDQSMYQNLSNYSDFNDLLMLSSLPDVAMNSTISNKNFTFVISTSIL